VGELSAPRLLEESDHRLDFDCGDEPINHWFRGSAWRSHTTRTSRVYVVLRDQRVAGFYALANSAMNRKHLPTAMQDKLPRHPIPLLLLARLGVDHEVLSTSGLRTCSGDRENLGVSPLF
jgi:hypothetical protein